MVRALIRLAADLGAPIVRVFAAWSGVTRRDGLITYDVARYNVDHRFPGTTQLERWRFARDCLAEAAEMAGRHGVTLALQNHEPIIHGHEEVLEFIEEVGSPHLQVSLDCPLMKDQSEEAVRRAVRETGNRIAHSHYGGEFDDGPDGVPVPRRRRRSGRPANYPVFIHALKEQGYQGYLCYELCHPFVVGHRHAGLEEALEQVNRAAAYMRHVIQSA
jgi:sugar phosphate isomerase/epimerase